MSFHFKGKNKNKVNKINLFKNLNLTYFLLIDFQQCTNKLFVL